jgi:hypothetical protein
MGTARSLSAIEERICNGAAAEVLIPDQELADLVTPRMEELRFELLPELTEMVANHFSVPRSRAFRRLVASKLPALQTALGSNYCCLVVGYGNKTGAGIGPSRLRLFDAWWPRRIAGLVLKPVHFGMELRSLGDELHARASAGISAPGGLLSVPLTLPAVNGATAIDLTVRFNGAWAPWGSTRSQMAVIFGELENTSVEKRPRG